MAGENKSVEETKDEKPSCGDNNGRSKHRDEPFPPKLSFGKKCILGFCYIAIILALFYLIEQFCSIHAVSWLTERSVFLTKVCRPCVWGTYIAFGVMIAVLVINRLMQHNLIVHKERLEDISEVEALFVEARTVECPSTGPMADQQRFERKRKDLLDEVRRLTELGNRGWTEYQVLSLNQMLVDFLEEGELKARARSSLADLEDYAEDSAYRYDQKQYDKWKDDINGSIDKIDEAENDLKTRDERIKTLQAQLRTLLEHVANYRSNWSQGSAILNGIRICSVLAIPLLLGMGLLPIVHPANVQVSKELLGFFNWGLLGMIGAIAAVLLNLRKSDYVEVGNTEGRKELWRAIPGIGLGFIAGTLAYWMFAGGLFTEGSVVPTLESSSLRDIGLSTVWAVASGFCFEKVFDRMVSTTLGGS